MSMYLRTCGAPAAELNDLIKDWMPCLRREASQPLPAKFSRLLMQLEESQDAERPGHRLTTGCAAASSGYRRTPPCEFLTNVV